MFQASVIQHPIETTISTQLQNHQRLRIAVIF